MSTRTVLFLASLVCIIAARADVPLVIDGKPAAVIVTARNPGPVAQYAAEELALHIEKASGVRLPIVKEGAIPEEVASRIMVGNSDAARAAGIDVSKLESEAFVLRTSGNTLLIAGHDKNDDPLDSDTRAGTLWGVYEWLDRDLGVRWLWPGELGTFVPKKMTVVAHHVNETIPPRFLQRRLRPGLGFTSEHPAMGFTAEAFKKFSHEQSVFLRRHRMGRSQNISYGHAFTDWWDKFGKDRPEWFQLRESGKRGPSKRGGRFSMCVSNPEFQDQVVKLWDAKRSKQPGVPGFINAVENDILGLCACEACQALDGPAPADYLTFYSPTSKMTGSRFVSDRYAHFWLGVQQRAAKIDPQATVIGYVYFNYFSAPTTDVKLNDRILLGYCPSAGWFPRSADEHAWMKRQWDGWRATGARLFTRTNHLLDGYCMPFIFARQFADDFQHAVKQGMVATDFDSLTGHWGTQGPNLYMAARLHDRPEMPADEILAEYYSAFGPAGTWVKQYSDYWESYTTTNRERILKVMEETQTSRWRNWAKAAHIVYPESCFVPPEEFLSAAARAAVPDREAAERVQFLKLGLDHAKLCARTSGKLSLAGPAPSKEETEAALKELLAFRRAAEKSGISNFNHLAWVEDLSWKLSDETKQPPDLYP
jgi:hypothetical protein